MTYKVVRASDGAVVCFGPDRPQYQPVVKNGETLSIEEAVPTFVPKHPSTVRRDAEDLINQHFSDARRESAVARLLELVGVPVASITDNGDGTAAIADPMTAGQKVLGLAAVNALKWRADVLKERDAAITENREPVWPAWNTAWEAIYPFI